MKIIKIIPFETMEGTGKDTEFSLDERNGLFFKIETSTYFTPYFTANEVSVPAIMRHAENTGRNVTISINSGKLNLNQIYQQAKDGYLTVWANDDWVDSDEMKQVYIDALTITKVKTNGGVWYPVTVRYEQAGVNILIDKNNMPEKVYVQEVMIASGKTYYRGMILSSRQTQTNPVVWGYPNVNIQSQLNTWIREE